MEIQLEFSMECAGHTVTSSEYWKRHIAEMLREHGKLTYSDLQNMLANADMTELYVAIVDMVINDEIFVVLDK